ncbi:AAA family ATPase, partial [Candidatus Woesearchaeota archaeon]|nr:AAA family ATPase [Candidatus Woesearchaeota archaeon]
NYFDTSSNSQEARRGTQERKKAIEWIARRAKIDLEKGLHVLIDSTFVEAEKRGLIYEVASRQPCDFYIINCVCPDEEEISRRLKRRMEESSDPRDEAASPKIYDAVKKAHEPLGMDQLPQGLDIKVVKFDTNSERVSYPNLNVVNRQKIRTIFEHITDPDILNEYIGFVSSKN